jgi:hypothetical protein
VILAILRAAKTKDEGIRQKILIIQKLPIDDSPRISLQIPTSSFPISRTTISHSNFIDSRAFPPPTRVNHPLQRTDLPRHFDHVAAKSIRNEENFSFFSCSIISVFVFDRKLRHNETGARIMHRPQFNEPLFSLSRENRAFGTSSRPELMDGKNKSRRLRNNQT